MRIELKIEADPTNKNDAAMLSALMGLFAGFANAGGSSFAAVQASTGVPVYDAMYAKPDELAKLPAEVRNAVHSQLVAANNAALSPKPETVAGTATATDGVAVCDQIAPAVGSLSAPVASLSTASPLAAVTEIPKPKRGRPAGAPNALDVGIANVAPATASEPESVTAPPSEGPAPAPVAAATVAVTPTPSPVQPEQLGETAPPAVVAAKTEAAGEPITLAKLQQTVALIMRDKTIPNKISAIPNLMLSFKTAGLSTLPADQYPAMLAALEAIRATAVPAA